MKALEYLDEAESRQLPVTKGFTRKQHANDVTPNWLTHPILPSHFKTLEWQWNEVAFPYWEKAVKIAKERGVTKIAIENLGFNLST